MITEWKLPLELNDVLAGSPADGPNADLALSIRGATAEATRLGFGVLDVPAVDRPDPSTFEIAERVNQVEQDLGI